MGFTGGWIVTFYGSDNTTTGNFPIKTTVAALASLTSWTVTIAGAGIEPLNEGEVKEACNKTLQEYNVLREKYTFRCEPQSYGTTTALQTFYPIDFLKKPYKWIDWGSYPVTNSGYSNTKVQAIIIEPNYTIEDEDGFKRLVLSGKSRGTL